MRTDLYYDFLKEITKLNHYKDLDMADESIAFYREFFPWIDEEGMRGDTICSFGTSFGAVNKSTSKDLKILTDGKVWKRGYTKALFQGDEKEEILKYRTCYHSLANFWVMPAMLNCWRGKDDVIGNLPAQADFIDVFLNCVRNYYYDIKNPESVEKMFSDAYVQNWFAKFGQGEKGWKRFIDLNYMNAFVLKESYLVKDIFDVKFKSDKASVFGTFHEYGKPLHQHAKNITAEESAINFVRNSMWAMKERARQLAGSAHIKKIAS